jgi:DNA-binding MarR family transcriptional regulator
MRAVKGYYERQFENEEFLLFRLSSVSRRVASACADVYFTEFGITVSEWRLMAQIGRFGTISAKDVAEIISMDRVAISRAAAKCLEEGLIRETTHPHDRRSKVLSFTRKGAALYKAIIPRACQLANTIEAGLSATESRMFKSLLDKVEKSLDQIRSTSRGASDAA